MSFSRSLVIAQAQAKAWEQGVLSLGSPTLENKACSITFLTKDFSRSCPFARLQIQSSAECWQYPWLPGSLLPLGIKGQSASDFSLFQALSLASYLVDIDMTLPKPHREA